MAGPRSPIQSFAHGVRTSDSFILEAGPRMLDEVPFVSNSTGGNKARYSGWDVLSSGSVPGREADAIFAIVSGGTATAGSIPAYMGQMIGSHNYTIPGLSGVAVLWKPLAATVPDNGTSGVIGPQGQGLGTTVAGTPTPGSRTNSGTSRRLELSATGASHLAGDLMPEALGINTTIVTWISSAFECAVLYKDGSSSTYTVSADARMRNTGVAAATNDHAISGTDYHTFKNVGPNIRRLVALGYR